MQQTQAMENRLKSLIEANGPANRAKWAQQWKGQGKKVIGTLCSYVPEEVIYAAGMLPWRMSGAWREAVPLAETYRPAMTCRYCSHVLESVLAGELDFLDGVVSTQRDDDFKRLWDVLDSLDRPPATYIMYLPFISTDITLPMWVKSIAQLKQDMEELAGVKVTEQGLRHAIEVYNTMRTLLTRVYELRKREVPPLTGAEVLGLTTAATVMSKDDFNRELEALLPYLETRKASLKQLRPRLLVTSDMLDNPAYLKLVEDVGCLVAMDDLDTGSRYFWDTVDLSKDGLLPALAQRYFARPACPRMVNWPEQAEQIIQWVKDFSIDGVLELRQLYSLPRDFRIVFLRDRLTGAGIPNISFSREYHLAHEGMLRTRIGAFMEMLQARAAP